ncbi:MAG: hypothetical protein EOM01_12345 [Spirochaetia bacterium]|nr:hypothetical protein [Spirochaetia bacterium]
MNKTTTEITSIINDIEYLRSHGTYPWAGAGGRRSMEKRYSYQKSLTVNGKSVEVKIITSASCSYTRFSVTVLIDGEQKRQYLKALKALVA